MKTASDILHGQRITLRSHREGNVKTLCPQCSHLRKSKRDPCLSVLIDDQGVQWCCHNCTYQGGEFYDTASPSGAFNQKIGRAQERRARGFYR